MRTCSCSKIAPVRFLALAVVCLVALPSRGGADDAPSQIDASPYAPSFRAQVEEAIQQGVAALQVLQAEDGRWGDASELHTMGHTSLALLACLKGGLDPASETATLAFRLLRELEMTTTYGVSVYLMAIHARYAPLVDVFESDLASAAPEVEAPDALHARLEDVDREALTRGAAFLARTQRDNGLFDYDVKADPPDWAYDLSNTLYAVLGLRAAAACGVEVDREVWLRCADGLLTLQEEEGEKTKLLSWKVRGETAKRGRTSAEARGFRYKLDRVEGPKGPWTAWKYPVSGSMTTAGVTALSVCRDEATRSRRKLGKRKRALEAGIRDGLTWLQVHFTVTDNPGQPGRHHIDYLYGLERCGMLTGRRWIGARDWYEEGARHLLASREGTGWGDHVRTAFAVLFLKRATPPPAVTGR